MDLSQIPGVQVPVVSRHKDHVQVPVVSRHRDHVVNQDWYLSVPTYGSTWVVLWLLFCRSAPSTFPNKRSTLQGLFRGVPSRYILLRN